MIALVFDTETSGLIGNHILAHEKQPEIIDFYGCMVDLTTGEILSEIDQLFKPKKQITQEITKITGLVNDDLKDAKTFAECAADIRAIIESAPAVIAHNLSFDMEMLDLEYERIGHEPLRWPQPKALRQICTVERTIHIRGYRMGLQVMYDFLFGENFKEAHRAKPDAMATLRCACELFKRGELV